MSDSRDFTGSYGRAGDIDGPAYWTAVVGQQELGLSRDQLYRSRQRLRSLSSGSWHCCLSLRVSAMVIAPTRLDLFILGSKTMPGLLQRFLPRDDDYFQLFARQAENIPNVARSLWAMPSPHTAVNGHVA